MDKGCRGFALSPEHTLLKHTQYLLMALEAKAMIVQSLLLKTGAMTGEPEGEVTRGVGGGNTGWMPFKSRWKTCFVMIVQNVSLAPD